MNRLFAILLAIAFLLSPLVRISAGECGSGIRACCCGPVVVEPEEAGCCGAQDTDTLRLDAPAGCGCEVRPGGEDPVEPLERYSCGPAGCEPVSGLMEARVLPPVPPGNLHTWAEGKPHAGDRPLRVLLNSWLC
jgi:hypothetical protein